MNEENGRAYWWWGLLWVGVVVGLLGGIATRPMNVPVPNDWVPATIAGRPAVPRVTGVRVVIGWQAPALARFPQLQVFK